MSVFLRDLVQVGPKRSRRWMGIGPARFSILTSGSPQPDMADPKPVRYLVEKELPTIPTELAEKVWNQEYVEMEEFLPAPRSLRLAERGGHPLDFQDSLLGALNRFQVQQQHHSHRQVTDILTWVRCFSLYMAVLTKKGATMVPSMVAHMHTVMHLHQ